MIGLGWSGVQIQVNLNTFLESLVGLNGTARQHNAWQSGSGNPMPMAAVLGILPNVLLSPIC